MRLKNKLGDLANASSEVEYRGAWGQLIGEPGKGVKTIIEMVQSTRLDCILGSAGAARRALQVAINHAVSGSSSSCCRDIVISVVVVQYYISPNSFL